MSKSRRFLDSPYIRCQPLSQAKCRPLICYYCGRLTRFGAGATARDATSDHVLTRAHYPNGVRPFDPQIPNRRPCCYSCNQLRARFGHCCGVLMMALIEAAYRGDHDRHIGGAIRLVGPKPKQSWRQKPSYRQRQILRWNRKWIVRTAMIYGV